MNDRAYDYMDEMVAEFFRSFSASVDLRMWVTLVREELEELRNALTVEGPAEQLKEAADLLYVLSGLTLIGTDNFLDLLPEEEVVEIIDLVDASNDELQKFLETITEWGLGFEYMMEAFIRVHKSNMSKLGEDGKPVRREDGKILKGPNYQPPVLNDLIPIDLTTRRLI